MGDAQNAFPIWNAVPLVALDVYEHAYALDFGTDREAYIDAFFANLGNLTRTAEALHVHRNTLLYRLGRIKEISGLNLEDAEERLALWLALKAHRVLRTLDENDSGL